MKTWQYGFLLVAGALCVGLSVAVIVLSVANQRLQQDMQARQQRLADSVLGQKGQAIANGVLQDMAIVATTNRNMSQLLARHGFTVNSTAPTTSTNDATVSGPGGNEP